MILRRITFVTLLSLTPLGYATDEAGSELGEVVNILVGAYNGAAQAAAQNDGTTAQTIDPTQRQAFADILKRYQGELQGVVNADGQVDTQRLGQFLNRLQVEHNGKVSYDFGQALTALSKVSPEEGPQALLNQHVITALVQSAQDQDLNRELSEAAPYIGTMLQIGSLLARQDKHAADSKALTAEINALKQLAERYQAQPDLTRQAAMVAAQLKLLYADQALGVPADAANVRDVKQALQQLYQQVLAARPQRLSDADFASILRPLAALGAPFAKQHEQWQALRDGRVSPDISSFDAQTRQLLDALGYDALPADVQQALLQRLHLTP